MRAALATGLVVLIALVAGEGVAPARIADSAGVAQAKRCQAQTKKLNAFKRKMAARKRAFFRSHPSRKARRKFVKKQAKQLKALKRARTRCLKPAVPPPAGGGPAPPTPAPPSSPPAQPPAVVPDTTPPALSISSPGAGAWFDAPVATLRGSASDAGSGVAAVTCGGQAAALAGETFTCDVPLTSGANAIAVSARDGAGNVSAADIVVNHGPGGLTGEGAAAATVPAVDADPRHADSEVSVTPDGRRVARTEITLHLEPAATVEQVNTALRSVGGRIVGAVPASPQLAVAIPDPGGLPALQTLLAGLRTRPGVDRAGLADMPVTDELPAHATPPSVAEAEQLSHLLAMRMPAAWNARRAIDLAQRPTLLIADIFGKGPLSPQVDATYNNADLIVRPGALEHGYHVVGIAASSFASNGTAAGNVTGVFGATARMHLIDGIGLSTQMTGLRIINEARARAGRVVVNTSLGAPGTDAEAQESGSDWLQLVRATAGLENRMLHATSAGNSAAPAARNSRWSAAAVRTDLTDAADEPTPALRNTLSVENLHDSGSPAYEPRCLAADSNRGGTIAAVGVDVFSHRFGALAGNDSGTSMASPEVAGLAMFLWSIAPDLTGPQLRNAIVATAQPPLPLDVPGGCGSDVPSAPRLDAYTAVLSLDRAEAITPATAPVRMAIADRDGDGTFDEEDLENFAAAARPDAGARDWSRSDLNGDGFTGGTATVPLDLDPTGRTRGAAPRLETVEESIEGIAVDFDERAVSDLDALCYLAYSDLYTGSVDQRAVLLDPRRNCRAVGAFTNGKLVVTGRGTRTGGLFGPERLWFVEPPGAPVAFTPEGVAPGRAAWSPDGTRIAFPRRATGTPSGIWTAGAGGESPAHVAGTGENDLDPTWAPDGRRIAFVRRQSPSEGIFIVDAAGGEPALIPGTVGFQDPSWSPDGRKIAAAKIAVTADIMVFAPDGTGMVNLSDDTAGGDIAPDWSPDGSRIVFVSGRPVPGDTDRARLWIMDADGSDVTQFTAVIANNPGGTRVEDFNPSWSPDGQKIAFHRTHQNGSRIVMTKDVTGGALAVAVTPVPTATTDATFADPDWQPVPTAP